MAEATGALAHIMKNIIFVTNNKYLKEDVETSYLIGDAGSQYSLTCMEYDKGTFDEIKRRSPDLLVLSYDVLGKRDSWKIGDVPIAYHAMDKDELEKGSAYGLPTIGIAPSSADILECLKKNPYQAGAARKEKQKTTQAPKPKEDRKAVAEAPQTPQKKKTAGEQWLGTYQGTASQMEELDSEEYSMDDLFDGPDIPVETGWQEEAPGTHAAGKSQEPGRRPAQGRNKAVPGMGKPEGGTDLIEEGFRKDTHKEKGKTKVVTVYSAKGGVGKTTIATELALYLSLVSLGKRNLRVCLVDYNIDYGDVKGTLALDSKGLSLTNWADEVKELLGNGKSPDEIVYTKQEIEEWLRYYKQSGLYVLVAPVSHADSMSIDSDVLEVIMDKLIEYGEFDYIICDTGNNTRDSTMIALEHADTILMIMTQNVNTAFCDKAFVDTMEAIDFDLSRAKLVINYIMPQKATGVTVQEIVDFFPYECVGKIRFNTDVISATNLGKPLAVFHPDHDFITQMRSIVTYLLQGNDFEVQAPKKKGLFSFLKRKG